jgi:RimJ/RimL family protein N-acetyltransferase
MSAYPGVAAIQAAPTLDTARLKLRFFQERDLDELAAITADAETVRYLGEGKTFTRAETWRAIAAMAGHWLLKGYGMWAVELKAGGAMVGRVGFYNPEGWPGFELGWTIARPQWGHGYATEAALAARDYGIATLGRKRIISLIRPANTRSIQVAERIGFRHDGDVELLGSPALVYANAPA